MRAIGELMPYDRNSRTHSKAQIKQIERSIREFGFTIPILIDEANQVIAGHARLEAAKSLGIENVPVVIATDWTNAQRRAYVIADNKLALSAGWDLEILRAELIDLSALNFEVELTGFVDVRPVLEDLKIEEQQKIERKYGVQLDLDSEQEMLEWIERLKKQGAKCRALIF